MGLFNHENLQVSCYKDKKTCRFIKGFRKLICSISEIKRTFKGRLNIVINDRGEIINYQITPGNCDDREPLKDGTFTKNLFGKLIADRGYISQNLFDRLFVDDIHMITKIKKNMKNSLMHLYDKVLLRKRALIETVNDMLKNVCQIEHTRHRSVNNFVTNLISGIIAYNILPKKPELNIEIIRNPNFPISA